MCIHARRAILLVPGAPLGMEPRGWPYRNATSPTHHESSAAHDSAVSAGKPPTTNQSVAWRQTLMLNKT